MSKTYEELIRNTDFTQRVFNRIGNLFPVLEHWSEYNNNIENMPLSIEDKERLDEINSIVREMFAAEGCSENLTTKQINNLLNTFGSVEDQLKGLSDEQLATAAAGANVMKKLMGNEHGRAVLRDLSNDMSRLQKLTSDQF
jgi:coproporphyrinogen III oxidase-like Fe-S oxidoreductase